MEKATATQQIISYLTFSLGDEQFALNVGRVINILEMQTITKVPKSPLYMTGIINLRGEVLPVIDGNVKLGLPSTEKTINTCVLVVETILNNDMLKLGIMVDAVHEVLEIDDSSILEPPSLNKDSGDILSGVVEHDAKFIMVLDISKFLTNQEIVELKNLSKK